MKRSKQVYVTPRPYVKYAEPSLAFKIWFTTITFAIIFGATYIGLRLQGVN